MPKIKVLSRSEQQHTRDTAGGLDPVFLNPDPVLHPFDRSREYVRALNSTKLDKLLSKPFLGALSGHMDGVYAMCRHPRDVKFLVSGAGDGELRLWDVPSKQVRWRIPRAHQGMVRSVAYGREDRLLSVGADKLVKCWDATVSYQSLSATGDSYGVQNSGYLAAASSTTQYDDAGDPLQQPPVQTWSFDEPLTALSHQRGHRDGLGSKFASGGGNHVALWSYSRSEPVELFEWGTGTVTSLSFNHIQTDLLAGTTTDRDVIFYDVRRRSAVHKFTLAMRANCVAWNPMEAYHFTLANEDHNCYTFDVRWLGSALAVHTDHVGPVLSVDFSPTGVEFATGSYDRTVRIFKADSKLSREVFHTKRMQRIFTVQFSGDANYIFSGSDDTNVRIWKSNPSMPIGAILPREKRRLDYSAQLKERYKHVPELRRIAHHRHVPKPVLKKQKLKKIIKESQARKNQRVFAHARPEQREMLASAKKLIVVQEHD